MKTTKTKKDQMIIKNKVMSKVTLNTNKKKNVKINN